MVVLRPILILLLAVVSLFAQPENVILVTTDGLRWQEVFRGADAGLLVREDAGMKDAAEVRERFAGASPQDSRRRIFPFLWSRVAAEGAIFGNRDAGGGVTVRNRHRFSYPGYSEILTGKPQDDVIDSNDNRPNPLPTVLEIARDELKLPATGVALFGSWSTFTGIGAHTPGHIFINAGYEPMKLAGASTRLLALSREQFKILTPWRSVRHDYITFELALEYLRTVRPRVLHIALGETDDWAHESRYDRYLETAHYFDDCLRRLWEFVASDPHYRGHTTLLVTTDHGRGSTASDWNSHGADVKGAQFIWIAALGPHTRALGEVTSGPHLTQSDIAPSILSLLGIDPGRLGAGVGQPIGAVTGR